MPIPFSNDSSTQQGGTFTSGSTFYATINQQNLDNTSNNLKTFIDNKQDTLTNSTGLLGTGGILIIIISLQINQQHLRAIGVLLPINQQLSHLIGVLLPINLIHFRLI